MNFEIINMALTGITDINLLKATYVFGTFDQSISWGVN